MSLNGTHRTIPNALAGASHKLILVLDGDAEGGAFLAHTLREVTPYHAFAVHSGKQALKLVQAVKPDLILLGESLPDMQSADVPMHLHRIRKLEHVPVVSLSTHRSFHERQAPATPWLKRLLQSIKAALTSSS